MRPAPSKIRFERDVENPGHSSSDKRDAGSADRQVEQQRIENVRAVEQPGRGGQPENDRRQSKRSAPVSASKLHVPIGEEKGGDQSSDDDPDNDALNHRFFGDDLARLLARRRVPRQDDLEVMHPTFVSRRFDANLPAIDAAFPCASLVAEVGRRPLRFHVVERLHRKSCERKRHGPIDGRRRRLRIALRRHFPKVAEPAIRTEGHGLHMRRIKRWIVEVDSYFAERRQRFWRRAIREINRDELRASKSLPTAVIAHLRRFFHETLVRNEADRVVVLRRLMTESRDDVARFRLENCRWFDGDHRR